MSAPIGPGDWVECVASASSTFSHIEAGKLYRVFVLRPVTDCFFCGAAKHDGLSLESDATHNAGWCPKRFRPIYRPRADLIESLKAPPKRTKESA